MIEINKKEIITELIETYEQFIKYGNSDLIKQKADKIYSATYMAGTILEEELNNAIGPLDGLAWPQIIEKTQRPALSKERAIKILEDLKKINYS